MNQLKVLLPIGLCFLVGCGGGESSDSTPDQGVTQQPAAADTTQGTSEQGSESNTESTEESSTETTEETVVEETGEQQNDGIIDSGFDFSAVMTVELELDVTAVSNGKSYVSLCHYKDESSLSINYEDCLVRGATQMGQFESSFEAAPHFQQLGLAVWFIDTSIEPLEYQVTRMEMDMGKVVITATN